MRLPLLFLHPLAHDPAAFFGLVRPYLVHLVKFRDHPLLRAERHPRLLRRRKDMDIRRTQARIVHGADAHEAHGRTSFRIIAPDRDLADRAARDALALAARRRRVDQLGLRLEMFDAIRLVDRVQRMHRAGLALAPGAMTGMHDQRLAAQAIADVPAGAAAFHRLLLSVSPPPYT